MRQLTKVVLTEDAGSTKTTQLVEANMRTFAHRSLAIPMSIGAFIAVVLSTTGPGQAACPETLHRDSTPEELFDCVNALTQQVKRLEDDMRNVATTTDVNRLANGVINMKEKGPVWFFWREGQNTTRLVRRDEGFCYLTHVGINVGGQYKSVTVSFSDEIWWELGPGDPSDAKLQAAVNCHYYPER